MKPEFIGFILCLVRILNRKDFEYLELDKKSPRSMALKRVSGEAIDLSLVRCESPEKCRDFRS